jgi:serine phosphatase RsbU (regulator of sigma subunit)
MKQLFFVLTAFLLIISSCSKSKKFKPVVEDGLLNLTEWNFEKDGALKLNGEWEFYWNMLLNPEDFKDSNLISQKKEYFLVPNKWNNDSINNIPLSSNGYATYRLLINFNEKENTKLALRIPTYASSCKIFVNGNEISSDGIVGKNIETSSPAYTPHISDFTRDSTQIEIIMQVSNFFHRKGGTWHFMKIGTEKQMLKERENTLIIDIFLMGSILIMALYHFGLFALRKKEKYTLFFALFCIFITLRIGSTGEYLIGNFKFINWFNLVKFEYISLYLASLFFTSFLRTLFPNEYSKYVNYTILVITASLSFITLITKPIFFSHLVLYFQIVMILMCLYSFVILILGAVRKREGALVFLFGFLFFFLTIVNDTLHNNEIIDTTNYFALGVFVFIFSQAFLISSRFSKAFKKTELLTEELNYTNQNLEKIVKERTAEIEQQKEEILTQKEEVQSINDALQLVNEKISSQKDKLQLMNSQIQEQNEHIKASIRYAKTIQNAILPSQEKLNQHFDNYLIFRPKDVVSGDFYWLNFLSEKKDKGLTEKIFIAVVDCTGHGVPGAFMSMIANRLLSEIINEKLIHSPDLILEELDKSIRITLDQDNSYNKDGMDLCLCKIEKDFSGNKVLTFAGAKRPIYYYKSDEKKIIVYEPTRRSVGGYVSRVKKRFENSTLNLKSGDIITLSSDGYSDQNNASRKRFSSKQLIKILESNVTLGMSEQKEKLENALNSWIVDTLQRDDITILTFKI